jgi:hypothetical protein
MRITKRDAIQVHPVPDRITSPKGPFPRELFEESAIVADYTPEYNEDGSGFALGATVQNNFNPPKYLRCALCLARVPETETENHVCED